MPLQTLRICYFKEFYLFKLIFYFSTFIAGLSAIQSYVLLVSTHFHLYLFKLLLLYTMPFSVKAISFVGLLETLRPTWIFLLSSYPREK